MQTSNKQSNQIRTEADSQDSLTHQLRDTQSNGLKGEHYAAQMSPKTKKCESKKEIIPMCEKGLN